jgi:hypothetical protein
VPSRRGEAGGATLKARQAVEGRSWSHPQEPTTEEWWADVLADPERELGKGAVARFHSSARSTGLPKNHERPSLSPAASANGRRLASALT